MKYILVLLAGACDKPVTQIGERTPLDAAKLSNLHFFCQIRQGRHGEINDRKNTGIARCGFI